MRFARVWASWWRKFSSSSERNDLSRPNRPGTSVALLRADGHSRNLCGNDSDAVLDATDPSEAIINVVYPLGKDGICLQLENDGWFELPGTHLDVWKGPALANRGLQYVRSFIEDGRYLYGVADLQSLTQYGVHELVCVNRAIDSQTGLRVQAYETLTVHAR